MNHYSTLDPHSFWSPSVSESRSPATVFSNLKIIPGAIARNYGSLGSCFAQHVAKQLLQMKLNYIQSSEAVGITPFSGNYGNIYSPLQALQLVERAFSRAEKTPIEPWQLSKTDEPIFVDAFRPLITQGHSSAKEEVLQKTLNHLKLFKQIALTIDTWIITLGLTEYCYSTETGFVVPHSPFTVANPTKEERYEFATLSHHEVIESLIRIKEILDEARSDKTEFILTVSPVPLVATYKPQSVVVSNMASKSVLRSACEELSHYEGFYYFPSYEYVQFPRTLGSSFNDDFRNVRTTTVQEIMECFKNWILFGNSNQILTKKEAGDDNDQDSLSSDDVTCDDNIIEKSLRALKRSV